jgi:hypothetical protein
MLTTNVPATASASMPTPPLLRELHRIADEIEQDLAQALGIPDEPPRQIRAEQGGYLDALGLGARRHQLGDVLDQCDGIERRICELELAGLHLGEIEDVVDQAEQRLTGGPERPDISRLLRIEPGVAEQVGHAENTVERSAELMADGRQEARLGRARLLRPAARLLQRLLGGDAPADLAADALQHGLPGGDRDDRLDPGEPALALIGLDALVDGAGAARQRLRRSGDAHTRLSEAADRLGLALADQGRIGGVGVDDPALAAPHDQITLRLDQAAIAFLAVGELPEPIAQLLDIGGQSPGLACGLLPFPQQPDRDDGAGDRHGDGEASQQDERRWEPDHAIASSTRPVEKAFVLPARMLDGLNGFVNLSSGCNPSSSSLGRLVDARAVGQRLGEVDAPDPVLAVEIGEGARDLEHAMIAARRQPHRLGGIAQEREPSRIRPRHLVEQGGGAAGIGRAARKAERGVSRRLAGTGRGDAGGHLGRALGRSRHDEIGRRQRGNIDGDVDPIEHRAGNPGLIAGHAALVGLAAAGIARLGRLAAAARDSSRRSAGTSPDRRCGGWRARSALAGLIGWRKASSAWAWNSGSSSRKSTP